MGITQCDKVSPQMSPAPLDRFKSQVHLGSITHHGAGEVGSQERLDVIVFAIRSQGEHREVLGRIHISSATSCVWRVGM